MTIHRHTILNGNLHEIAQLEKMTQADNWVIWQHTAHVIEGDIVEVFWLQKPTTPKPDNQAKTTLTVANDVAMALQEEQLERLLIAVKSENFVLLDTETTGIGENDIVVSIAFVNPKGQTVGEYIVNTPTWCGQWGTKFHGIKEIDIYGGTLWPGVFMNLVSACAGKHIIAYNAAFDMRLIRQTCVANNYSAALLEDMQPRVICAMEAFAVVYGEISPNKPGYKWQKLSAARDYYSIEPLPEHQALTDAQMTLKVVRAIADDTTWHLR